MYLRAKQNSNQPVFQRQLGSFFHIAMNGMAAWDKIEKILSLPEPSQLNKKAVDRDEFNNISIEDVSFSYDESRRILDGIDMEFKKGQFIGIAGKSGCGKSTITRLITVHVA